MVRILSSNPARRGMNWTGLKQVSTNAKRGVNRLIARDPADGLSLPFADDFTVTDGVTGLSGVSPATEVGKTESKQTGFGGNVELVPDRSVDKTIKKR